MVKRQWVREMSGDGVQGMQCCGVGWGARMRPGALVRRGLEVPFTVMRRRRRKPLGAWENQELSSGAGRRCLWGARWTSQGVGGGRGRVGMPGARVASALWTLCSLSALAVLK